MYDIVLKDGLVVDPCNNICGELNVAVNGGKIARISDRHIEGKKIYDCKGLVVAPGFVDVHAHEDALSSDGSLRPVITERLLRMGVTTFIGGQCGIGAQDEEEYRRRYNSQPINCALLTAHGALRELAGAADKYAPATDTQLEVMCQELENRLTAGSYGLSISPRYIPGTETMEMLALARVVRVHDGIMATHVRDDCEGSIEAIAEFIEMGRKTGVRLQISHIGSIAGYGQMKRALAMLDAAAADGIDVFADCYPYEAFCTSIGSATYDGDFLSRYGDITKFEITEGKFKGPVPSMDVFQEIRMEHPEYLTVAHVMLPEDVEMALCHPRVMLGSDGVLLNGAGHPRAAGAFARFLREYVAERKALSLYEAVNKMTWGARRFGLKKGCLKPGWDADIVAFNPSKVKDNATFSEPGLMAEGFCYIFIGGKLAVKDDKIVNASLGQALTKTR